jgi:ParB family chromosome partitioning protein
MQDSQFQNNAVFFIEVDKIKPNPFQPRKEFDEAKLNDLAGSIRMYGILQPLVVTRKEIVKEDGGLATEYELISGERRLRASRIAGLREVPVLIRNSEQSDREKLELAIIENLQREDLNPVDRAKSFKQLAESFGLTHSDIAKRIGKSREYVSNSIRILLLPEEMVNALSDGKISEGHTRPLLMLCDRPEEQLVIFKEIILKKMTVRESEKIARKIAYDKVRKKDRMFNPEIIEIEEQLKNALGTRVHIELKEVGGKLMIDFFNNDDLRTIINMLNNNHVSNNSQEEQIKKINDATTLEVCEDLASVEENNLPLDDRSEEEKIADENSDDLYSVKNFTI